MAVVGEAQGHTLETEMNYDPAPGGEYVLIFRDLAIENVTCDRATGEAMRIVDLSTSPVQNLTLKDITIDNAEKPTLVESA